MNQLPGLDVSGVRRAGLAHSWPVPSTRQTARRVAWAMATMARLWRKKRRFRVLHTGRITFSPGGSPAISLSDPYRSKHLPSCFLNSSIFIAQRGTDCPVTLQSGRTWAKEARWALAPARGIGRQLARETWRGWWRLEPFLSSAIVVSAAEFEQAQRLLQRERMRALGCGLRSGPGYDEGWGHRPTACIRHPLFNRGRGHLEAYPPRFASGGTSQASYSHRPFRCGFPLRRERCIRQINPRKSNHLPRRNYGKQGKCGLDRFA
jgi:hypothetical protein